MSSFWMSFAAKWLRWATSPCKSHIQDNQAWVVHWLEGLWKYHTLRWNDFEDIIPWVKGLWNNQCADVIWTPELWMVMWCWASCIFWIRSRFWLGGNSSSWNLGQPLILSLACKVQEVGWDSSRPGYDGLIDVAKRLLLHYPSRQETEQATVWFSCDLCRH
jgi:hypothetical protein